MIPAHTGTGPDASAADDPRSAVRLHELSISDGARRRLGAHYTPKELADRLVGLAFTHANLDARGLPRLVCDPSCGAGSILVSVADELAARGVAPAEVLARRIIGCDIDPAAVQAARRSLSAWAVAAGEPDPPTPRIFQADALALPADLPEVDMVVGNPPFASPLNAEVARRRSSTRGAPGIPQPETERDGAYVDDSALHLRAAVELVTPGGVVCLLQPQSLLGSRDAASVRSDIADLAVLEALWASGGDHFSYATVSVCAPVLVRRHEPRLPGVTAQVSPLVLWEHEPAVVVPLDGIESWAPLLAGAVGTPKVAMTGARASHGGTLVTVGDLARCTAGFREEFYALASVAYDSAEHVAEPAEPDRADRVQVHRGVYRLVTSGMVDPGVLRWGEGSWRLAGRRFVAPVADHGRIERDSPRVARWSAARAVPKVLVASQTKVIEAFVDRDGNCVPVTPVVSVEPTGACSPAALAAMLSAPTNSALLATGAAGTGRSSTALRVAASAVASLTLNADERVWSEAEGHWRSFETAALMTSTRDEWLDLGAALQRLLSTEIDEDALTWWVDRLPRRLVR